MTPFALSIVLLAAFLHALWNALVKGSSDRATMLAGVTAATALFGLAALFVADPPAPASWPYIVASVVIHWAYYALLYQAYRLGDLSQVYPISRGMAPALVAAGAFLVIGETMPVAAIAGLAAVSLGILILAMLRGAANADRRAVMVALVLGSVIAVYSVVDGIGIRLADSPLGYIAWLYLMEFPIAVWILWPRWRRREPFPRKRFAKGLMGGVFSVVAYGLALYATTIAPLGAVSAVRESSVVIAAIIGLVVFRERPWPGRLLAAAIVAGGVVLLASAR
ncbi:MAG: EamA family transporter [Rhodobiaceae bacterium]|nr:EamA family transporter [Rhodobiaceae bacterium]MCC0014714.1 EamA family transporter [Rhodobiaceae bacterium]MCC0041429.1 EamA family transporter [Rhodobiaceae bacterium]MCC0053782.1 EamA family transporter [Rhodobiaceae bacterium]